MRSKSVVAVAMFLLLCSVCALSPAEEGGAAGDAAVKASDCAACHACATPTGEDHCLRACTRPGAGGAADAAAASPDVIVIDKLSDLYMPVVFPHRLHAGMGAMAGGCKSCHHQTTGDTYTSCGECHGRASDPKTPRVPNLKGAYHRQCLSCHREWSGDTKCEVCHAKRAAGQAPDVPETAVADMMANLHPNTKTPDKFLYPTPELEEGSMVTFNHKEHVELFGRRCEECHTQGGCGRCHNVDVEKRKQQREDYHQDCVGCHKIDDDCTACHMKEESPGFNHEKRTGYPMKPYHAGVACQKCHTDPATFKGLKRECLSCHPADWAPQGFPHEKSGKLTLDKDHAEIDCAGCHPDGMGTPIKCDVCHEADIQYPARLPGTLLAPPAPVAPVAPAAAPGAEAAAPAEPEKK